MIYTIGYGGRTIDEFLALLEENLINYVIDVRTKPYSRHYPDFSQNKLADSLKINSINYIFMGDSLGGRPSSKAFYTNGTPDYSKLARSEKFKLALSRLVHADELNLNLAVLCSEKDPRKCHRFKLIGEELARDNVCVNHINPDSSIVSHNILAFNNEQPMLF